MKKLLAILLLLISAPALALGPYPGDQFIIDEQGNAVAALTVTVYLAGTTTTADLYSDNGITPIANPLTTDYRGHFMFWAPNGSYDICYSGAGFEPWCDLRVKIIDTEHVGASQFNVTDSRFGAVAGDGLSDTAAFQACLDALDAVGGGTMVVPSGGVFNIDTTVHLPSNIRITGGGIMRSGITLTGYVNGAMFIATGEENIVVDGVVVDGADTSTSYEGGGYPGTFHFRDCTNVKVLDSHFYDCGADGVLIAANSASDYCEDVLISGCTFERCHRDGVAIIAVDGIVVTDCQFIEIYGQPIDIEPNVGQAGVDNFVISNCTMTNSITELNVTSHWGQAIGISQSGSWIGSGVVTGNHISYLFPDDYLATAAASTNYCEIVTVNTITGPLIFSDNVIVTNRMSDQEGNYGVVTLWSISEGIEYSNNVIYRPETMPAVASGEGHAAWKGLSVLSCDHVKLSGSVRGSFNTPLWVNDCDDVDIYMQIENTANSILANVTGAAFIRQCNDVKMTGSYSSPDNTIALDAVDGLLLTGAILKSSGGGVHIRNTSAASGSVSAIGCVVDQSDSELFPNTAMARSDDGNAIALFVEANTVDKAIGGGGGSVAGTGYYNVLAYGALGDGVADDAAGIQAAIDAAEAAFGGVVFFPPGVYLIGTMLTVEGDAITLQGSGGGKESSVSAGTLLQPYVAGAPAWLLRIGHAGGRTYNSGIKDIGLYGTNPYDGLSGLLTMLNCTQCFAYESRIEMPTAAIDGRMSVLIDTSTGYLSADNKFSGCWIESPATIAGPTAGYGYGVVIANSGYTGGSPEINTRNTFYSCDFYNPATDLGGKAFATTGNAVGRSMVTGSHFRIGNGDQGITLGGGYGGDVFVNCQIIGDGSELLTFEAGAEDCVFSGNIVSGTWSDANTGDDAAYVHNAAATGGPSMRALNLIPRASAPTSPGEGTIYYDSGTDTWKGVTTAGTVTFSVTGP